MFGPAEIAIWLKFIVAAGGCALVLALLAILAHLHRRNLAAIGIRVHVAGTRGKSATVRLIAAGLRARGLRVVAKTTGTTPRVILPDGSETTWRRFGAASIGEQARFVRLARGQRADALVVECMAIRPELVWASERQLVRAHVGVITNTHADHAEELGLRPAAMAEALAQAAPAGGRLFITDQCDAAAINALATARASQVHLVDVAGLEPFEANQRLAATVCNAVCGPTDVPEIEAASDPGAFRVTEVERSGRCALIATAFACNDASSLRALWAAYQPGPRAPVAFLFNGRADRPLRSRALLRTLHELRADALVFIVGGGPLKRLAKAAGFDLGRIVDLRGRPTGRLLDLVLARCPAGSAVWGVGNYRGAGAAVMSAVAEHERSC